MSNLSQRLSSLCTELVRGASEFCDLGEDVSYFALSEQISPQLLRLRTSLKQSAQRLRTYVHCAPATDLSYEQIQETSEDLFEQLNIRLDTLRKSRNPKLPEPSRVLVNNDAIAASPASQWSVQNSYHLFVPLRSHKFDITKFMSPTEVPQIYSQIKEEVEINEVQTALIELYRSKPYLYSQVHFPGTQVFTEYQPFKVIQSFPHPYTQEIQEFEPTKVMLKVQRISKGGLKIPVPPSPLSDDSLSTTPFHYIDTLTDFNDLLLPALQKATELAIDLEHHHQHSYLGKTCLLQVSTRDIDFVVDTITLRSHIVKLASIFQNPYVVKVFHGADSDMLWLQRDFGLYVVNLFDTGRASRLLQFPSHSYAHLLQHFCKVKTDKSFQLADWRERPLSPEMLKYARMDTHYLLHIYDCMKVELERKGQQNSKATGEMLLQAWQSSAMVALRVYTKPKLKDDQYESLIERNRCLLSSKLLKVLKLLLKWRDWVARRLDLNSHILLKNSSLFRIVKQANSTYADLEHLLSESCPLLGSQMKQYALDLFQRLQAKLRGKKPKQSQLVSDPQLRSPLLKPQKPKQDKIQILSTRGSLTCSQRGSLMEKISENSKSEVINFLVRRLKKNQKRETSKFTEKLGLKELMEEQMQKLKSRLEERKIDQNTRNEKIIRKEEQKMKENSQEENPVEGDVITFASELPAPLKAVQSKKEKLIKKRKAQDNKEEEPIIVKKKVEEQDDGLKEKAQKMLKGSYKSLEELRGTEKMKRKIKQQQKQISRKQKELSRRAPTLFGSKN